MAQIIERKAYLEQLILWQEKELIKVVTGVRRCGKSTLFMLFIDYLKKQGVLNSQIVSINLEDENFSHLRNYKQLHDYIESHIVDKAWTYVFIDEVQNCAEYERAIASLYLRENVDIYLTGSNAHLLSGELATKLTARYVQIDMLPLSFLEFGELVTVSDRRDRFNLYLSGGGFPYAAKLIDNTLAHHQYLEGIYNTVLVKDVLTRKGINDTTLLKSITSFLADNIGNPVSAKKIADYLSSRGRPTGSATVDGYLEALCDAYLFYKVNRYDIKGKLHLRTEPKYYICDLGLRNMIVGTANKDIGRQIEGMVYLELLRRGYRVTIGKSGRGTEVDFIAFRDGATEYYQVSASVLDPDTLTRELTSLTHIKDNYPKYLITLDEHTANHSGVEQINLIDWLGTEQ